MIKCLFALIAFLAAGISEASAQTVVNNHTPCSVAIFAFESKDREAIIEVDQFIQDVFGQLDEMQADYGEHGGINKPASHGMRTLVASSVEFCRQHPQSTIYTEAVNAYRGIRAIESRSSVNQ
jgi:hypothetical protein